MHAPSLTPDDFRRIREVFEAALDCPGADRPAFVSRACEGDPSLIVEVEQMLAGDVQRHALLDGSEQVTTDDSSQPVPSRCPSCRAEVHDTDRFCRACGTPVASGTFGDENRFRAGALFARRFRIVALLGRGGMGQVYRAQDLEVGQQVALKFLTSFRSDARARARLRTEVRLARQISHPNVCRVYDIGDADGDLYLSMEYVDGEDLATLLKRIGRLPIDKGVEVTRKLCAGLAAAHAKGVLHRDLKPGNIMIDARGEVRIMDFGLAAMTAELEAPEVRSGTPAYMAPEQLAGREVTKQSDIYALGLVMYELLTGRPAFTGKNPQELLRQRESHPSATPSTLIPDLGPLVERTILRCLEPDPKMRPASALDVAATLPGGDPLAEALAAGETPSPELVAASGHVGSLSPAVGAACLAAIALGLTGIIWMSQRTTITGHVPLTKSPEIMAERARTIAADLGYPEPDGDVAYGYDLKAEVLQHLPSATPSPDRWDVLRSKRVTALGFWYRHSPQPFSPAGVSGGGPLTGISVTLTDPPVNVPGMLSMEIDSDGRLAQLIAVPRLKVQRDADTSSPDWARLFRHAGLDIDRFTPSATRRVPPVFADQQGAWEGVLPDLEKTPIRVEAAAYGGAPVYFELVAPWNERGSPSTPRPTTAPAAIVYATIFALSLVIAYRNVKLGRADRRGAFRTAAILAVATLVAAAWVAHDSYDFLPFVGRGLVLGRVLWAAVISWTFYVALEPYVRRVWPEMLIGWSRLISGRVRDPLVGRDLLVGTLGGMVLAVAVHLRTIYAVSGVPPPVGPTGSNGDVILTLLANGSGAAAMLPLSLINGLYIGLVSAVTLVLLTMLLRRRWRAAVAWVAVWTVAQQAPNPADPTTDLIFKVIAFTIGIVLLVRFGLLATVVHLFVSVLLTLIAFRFDSATPYATASYVLLGAVGLLAVFGFHTAVAGQSVFGNLLREDATVVH